MRAAAVLLRGAGALAGLRGRADRRRAAALAREVFPGRLSVLGSRSLFPQAAGSEVLLSLADDPDAVVRIRVGAAAPGPRQLREAVARGLADARRWRALGAAFAEGGLPVHALGRPVSLPWVAAEVTGATVAEVTARLADCARRWSPREGGADVLVASPETVRRLPPLDPGLPPPLALAATGRLALLTALPYLRASFDAAGEPALSLQRPLAQQQAYEAAVAASAGRWLAGAYPGADVAVTAVMGVHRLLPGRVDRLTCHVLFRDGPEEGRIALGGHALRVTTDPDGAMTDEPAVLRDVREGRGPLRLPPL